MALLLSPNMFDAKIYEHRPLVSKPRVFRLVKLLPPLKSFLPLISDTLRVEIIEADLDSPSLFRYETISYTWGVPAGALPNRRVIIETAGERRVMWIHKPLEEALRNILVNRVTIQPLFIDQICIDQSNKHEKEVLVPLMGEIYMRCSRVIVWLGASTNLSDQFFEYTRELNEQGVMSRLIGPQQGSYMEIYDAVMDQDSRIELEGSKQQDRDDLVTLINTFRDRFSRESMIDVLQRPWFNRLWIIQEVCLAPDVTFLCGSKTLCFECFRCACAFFPLCNGSWMQTEVRVVSQVEIDRLNLVFELLESFNRMFRERKAIHQLGQRQSYYDIMLKYNVNYKGMKIDCTKAEDRLFAVLGLAGQDEVYGRIAVRYDDHEGDTRQSEGVYVDFASLAVRQNTDLLSFSQFPKSRHKLPSWVPDWSINLKLSRGYLTLTQPVHAAGGVMQDTLSEVDKVTRHLSVPGIVIGRILYVGACKIAQDMERRVPEQVDFASLRQFYEEAEKVMLMASRNPACPISWDSDEDSRKQSAINFSDFGLTAKYMADRYGYTADTIDKKLATFYEQASIWGQRLIDTSASVQSYSLSLIIRTVGIAPYYWIPASETDVLHLCATDPLAAAKTLMGGLVDFTFDMMIVCISSARAMWTAKWLRYRRSVCGFRFPNQHTSASDRDEVLKRVGLDPEIAFGREMADYMDFVYRNIGCKLYLAEGGYVGVGPETINIGDSAFILHGATVPHILRPQGALDRDHEHMLWAYIGEAYCSGVMEGQLLHSKKEAAMLRIE